MKVQRDYEERDSAVDRGYGFAMGVMKALFMVFIVFPICAGLVLGVLGLIFGEYL